MSPPALALGLALLSGAAPERLDLTPFGVWATVARPPGARAPAPQRDGSVYLQLDDQNFLFVERARSPYGAIKAGRLPSEGPLTVDRLDPNGDFLLGWDDLTPGRKSLLFGFDGGKLTCLAVGQDVERAAKVCRSLQVKRVGEVLRLLPVEGPRFEQRGRGWVLLVRVRAERDGAPVEGAEARLNGARLVPVQGKPGELGLESRHLEPGLTLSLDYALGGARGTLALGCPGTFLLERPRDGSRDPPGVLRWSGAPGAEQYSMELAAWDAREGVALPGPILGWAARTDREMSALVPGQPPHRVTATAYGPEPKSTVAPGFRCQVVRRALTGLLAADGGGGQLGGGELREPGR